MIPKLYDTVTSTEAVFLGSLSSCISCEVVEERNGKYTLTLMITNNDIMVEYIRTQRYILAKPNPHDSPQFFRIYKIERNTDNTLKLFANHIKTIACNNISNGNNAGMTLYGTPSQIYEQLESEYLTESGQNNQFVFKSDIVTNSNLSLGVETPELFGNIMAGKEGSFVDLFGGEYQYDNFTINFLASRGKKQNYKLKYGYNISSATQIENVENLYSQIYPYGKIKISDSNKQQYVYGGVGGAAVPIEDTQCLIQRTFLLDCTAQLEEVSMMSDNIDGGYQIAQEIMQRYAKKYAKDNDLGRIAVNVTIDVASQLEDMLGLALCDEITVVLDKFNSYTTAKITQSVYNTLQERWVSLTIGTQKTTLADIVLNRRRYIPNVN